MTKLDEAFNTFVEAAVDLLDNIESADAEWDIVDGYPFDKSFDEVVTDIIAWRDAYHERALLTL